MTSEDKAKFLKEFGPRRDVLLERLKKAANVGEGPMSLGKLDILAAASMELLTLALPICPSRRVAKGLRGCPRPWRLMLLKSVSGLSRRFRIESLMLYGKRHGRVLPNGLTSRDFRLVQHRQLLRLPARRLP